MKRYVLSLVLFFSLLNSNIFSQNYKILLDEDFSDWNDIIGISDSNDVTNGIDLRNLKVTNYNDFLFLLLELNTEINLQDLNSLILYIDTDNNESTGYRVNGIGAELEYKFGDRGGRFYYGNTSSYISHENIGLVSIPTVTSNIFEININLNSVVSGRVLFTTTTMKFLIKDNVNNGDVIPNQSGGFEFTLNEGSPQVEIKYSIKKLDNDDLRIVSYNIERDQLFDSEKKEAHRRIFQAIDPDIIGFQEIYNHSAQQTADLIEEFLPSTAGEQWYSSKVSTDIITVSRYPITKNFAIDQNSAFVIDLQEREKELLFVNAHTPCCANNDSRQKEIDNFMAFIRDAKEEGGVLTIDKNSPIVIVGDMNLVGYKQQQTTLVTGEILNTSIYGESFLPDWDNTHFADTKPYTTNMPSTFTWYDEGSSFSPGRLDYVVYSNSVMSATNSFALFTKSLPADSLTKYNLLSGDVNSVADHMPVIVDFKLSPTVAVSDNSQIDYNFSLSQNYPNPFNPTTLIEYSIPSSNGLSSLTHVTLKVFDVIGQEVATLVNQNQTSGNYEAIFDVSSARGRLTSGIYFYTLTAKASNSDSRFVETKKLLYLK